MPPTPVSVQVPGKLMLCGEWSVLRVGGTSGCVVLPVSPFLTVTVVPSPDLTSLVSLPDVLGAAAPALMYPSPPGEQPPSKCSLALRAIDVAVRFLKSKGARVSPFALTVTSQLSALDDGTGRKCKPGLGSSSATVSGVVRAMLRWAGLEDPAERVFKLAAVAQAFASGHSLGSCFDIAAASFATPLFYSRFDPEWLMRLVKASQGWELVSLVESEQWPFLVVEPLGGWNDSLLSLATCFSGDSALTNDLVARVNKLVAGNASSVVSTTLGKIDGVVRLVRAALAKGDGLAELPALLRLNRQLLLEFESAVNEGADAGSRVVLETPSLTAIIETAQEVGGPSCAAKFSGAGGGDCAIAVCHGPQCHGVAQTISKRWRELGYTDMAAVQLVKRPLF